MKQLQKTIIIIGLLLAPIFSFGQEDGPYFNLEDNFHPNNGRYVMREIYFGFDHPGITEQSLPELEKVSAFLKSHPNYSIQILGNTDYRGNDEYNLKLSEMRARSVMNWLVADSISSDRIEAIGLGETAPYRVQEEDTSGCSHLMIGELLNKSTINQWEDPKEKECALQLNRRIEMKIVSGGSIPEFEDKLVYHDIYFELASYNILPRSQGLVFKIANLLKCYPNYVFEIAAHTDCRGSAAYSIRLSQKRAEAVRELLIFCGVNENRLIAKGYEESDPLEYQGQELSCDYISTFSADKQMVEQLHQLNRRIEIRLISTDYKGP